MRWHRVRNGVYTAGPYLVEQNAHGWYASGPAVDVQHDTKADAQSECEDAALERLEGNAATAVPVVGDHAVVLADRRKDPRGTITTVIDHGGANQEPLYCVRFNIGGGRKCLFRREFELVMP